MSVLRLGIIGFGYMGKIHLKNVLSLPNADIIAVQSRSWKGDDDSLKGISFYTDHQKMLKQERLDAVIICTPTHLHHEISAYCAAQGLNIFLEKPMGRTISDCDVIINALSDNGVKLMVGHVLRFWPTYGSVHHHLMENGVLGGLKKLSAERLGAFPWSKWFADQRKSGGVILDLSIHDIDYATWLMGKPISVKCRAKSIRKYGMTVVGRSSTEIFFQGDKTAKCDASWAEPPGNDLYTHMRIKGKDSLMELNAAKILNNEKWEISNIFDSNDGYFNEMKHFVESILNGRDFAVSASEGKMTVKTCLCALESAKKDGKEVYLKD